MTKEPDKAPANSFLLLCRTLITIQQIPSEEERINRLSRYLQTVSTEPALNPDVTPELELAVRYAGEGIFPAFSGRRISIGHQTIAVAAAKFCDIDYEKVYKPCRSATGNTAETVGKLMANLPEAVSRRQYAALSLEDLHSFFEKLNTLKRRKDKEILLTRTWKKMTASEIRAMIHLLTQGSLLPVSVSGNTISNGLDRKSIVKAIARAFHAEPEEVRRVHMITGDLGESAVLARQGKLHTAGIRLFLPVPFMQPTTLEPDDISGSDQTGNPDPSDKSGSVDQLNPLKPVQITGSDKIDDHVLPNHPNAYIAEEMINGIRTQMHLSRQNVLLCSSTGTDITAAFPDAVDLQPPDMDTFSLILDGVLCICDESAVQPLHRLQKRMECTDPGPELIANHPARFIAHDLLFHNDQPLTDDPLYRRRKRLEDVCRQLGIPVIRHFEIRSKRDIALRITSAVQNGSCGIILKNRNSLYEIGEHSGSWLGLKPPGGNLKTVVMYAHTGDGLQRGSFSAFTIGIRVDNDPRYVESFIPIGKVTVANMNTDLEKLDQRIRNLTVERFGPTLSLKPEIVLEVEFESIQSNRRTKAGLALHKPRIRAVCPDFSPSNTDTLRHVEDLYHQHHNIAPAPESKRRPIQ